MAEGHIPFQDVVEALRADKDFPQTYIQYFSDIEPGELAVLMKAWPDIQPERKRTLLEQLELTAEEDTLVSFEDLGKALLDDPDPQVRLRAVRLLLESNDPKLVPIYIKMMQGDDSEGPRAEAARALAEFIMLGELEEIPEATRRAAETALLETARGQDTSRVRRRALESLGFSSRPEAIALVESSFNRQDPDWKASALFAMGRSSDERWEEPVVQMLLNDNPRIRLAAVQAAGELALVPARQILIDMLPEEEEDDIAGAVIWSLSQIGGEDSRAVIESLIDQAEEEDLMDFLQDALENLAFTEDLERFDLLSFMPEDIDEENED
jgi:HEAT repeat protein